MQRTRLRLNSLGRPLGIETQKQLADYQARESGLNSLGRPLGIETVLLRTLHDLYATWLNSLGRPLGIETGYDASVCHRH